MDSLKIWWTLCNNPNIIISNWWTNQGFKETNNYFGVMVTNSTQFCD
jgi:hypothetical protein